MEYLKAFFKRVYELAVKYPLAIASTVFLAIGIFVLAITGCEVQMGGLLEKLFGKKKPEPAIRETPPAGRVDKDGLVIQPGVPDDKGFVQAQVSTTIENPGLLSNPDDVTILRPDYGDVVIPLPVGVKNKDVAEVVEVVSDSVQVKNNDSGVDLLGLKDMLK